LKYGTNLRLKDPVICKSNIYREEYDLRNGSMGVIVEVYKTPKSFDIRKNVKPKNFLLLPHMEKFVGMTELTVVILLNCH
jgi:hypothetical protein